MKLLGDWNWYLPRWLRLLPRMSAEAEPEPRPGGGDPGALTPALALAPSKD